MKWRWRALVALGVLGAAAAVWQPWQTRLEVIRKGGKGPPDLMLLHGYGSAAKYWLPYAQTIRFPEEGRFLFPQAPESMVRADGRANGHAWWALDLAAHRRLRHPGVDLRAEDPAGLVRAAAWVRRALVDEGDSDRRPFVLGGFSQGAMVSCQVAFTTDVPLAALVILSGTPSARAGWLQGMAKRRGLPVFMAHGRGDDVLPFDLAEELQRELVAAGLSVSFLAFDGGHEMPAEVIGALGEFLAGLGLPGSKPKG